MVALVALASARAYAEAEEFVVQPGAKGNLVKFVSKAPAETFEGKTDQVRGRMVLDPAALADSITVEVEVPLDSLDTGIDLRNQHMRENHLETARYPRAVFRGVRLLNPPVRSLEPGVTSTLELLGQFDLHGVSRSLLVSAQVTLVAGEGPRRIHVVAQFPVKLTDYQISRPKFLVLKLDEVQQVTLDVTAVAGTPSAGP